MAQQQVSEASVASSASAVAAACGNWWDIHANGGGSNNPFSSWASISTRWPQPVAGQLSDSLADQEDLSINANASNHSCGFSMDSSEDLSGEPVENNLWSQVLFGAGSSEDMQLQNHHENGKNFLEVLTSQSLTREMLEPACDYLKRMDNSWEFTSNTPSIESLKQLSSSSSSSRSYIKGTVMEPERLRTTNLSDLIGNWSVALPNAQLENHLAPLACSFSLVDHSMAQYSTFNICHVKHERVPPSPAYPVGEMTGETSNATNYTQRYDINGMKAERHHQDIGAAPMQSASNVLCSPGSSCTILHAGLGSSAPGLANKYCAAGMAEADLPLSNTRSLSDLISSNGCLNKPATLMDLQSPKPHLRGLDSSCSKEQGHESSSAIIRGRATFRTSEGKKKISDSSEDSSETIFKKSKREASTASSIKLQESKVKLGEKITALQQLVSPFGKTDTASVLLETINCIKILQEQVQLLSDPYMKSRVSKDHSSWVDLQERMEKADQLTKLDLKSKGLCLIPVSCIPPSHRENNCPDYWMPPYRSCLYR